ncbi:hypothetical protein [Polymorphum gilvum]|uniref:DUF2946 domain-containing protein n=1 Tax=Polymorphum gilvum (strain LMG 25793 / CGMCC 1.9160 / SL003B-26A1) TaxID=991905 RepID=F2J3G7_POLGS|nr:hypothetical protein [Polymorphum gilvum]ADZ70992.1 hypothetical protein SL003B_2568 [Polymorphum gilvum SL003B-26A1]
MPVLCALALTLVAFAHRPVSVEPPSLDADLAAYLMLGGSLDDLCRPGADGDGPVAYDHCPACTLAKAFGLATAAVGVVSDVVWTVERPSFGTTSAISQHGPRAPPARGPPPLRMI